jgi:hypothetical protein
VPTLAALPGSLPIPGFAFTAVLGNLPLSAGVIAAGFSNTVTGPFALPLNLSPFGLVGCTLYVDPAVTLLLVGAANQVNWVLNIPGNPAFLNLRLYTQGFSLDPPANGIGLTVSNARRIVIGR